MSVLLSPYFTPRLGGPGRDGRAPWPVPAVYAVSRSRSATSSAFLSALFSASASWSFFSPFSSSLRPSRRRPESPVTSPAACLALPVILSTIPLIWVQPPYFPTRRRYPVPDC